MPNYRSAIMNKSQLTVRFASDQRTVTICEILDEETGAAYVGTAKCNPLDEFDPDYGKNLALSRALISFSIHASADLDLPSDTLFAGVA